MIVSLFAVVCLPAGEPAETRLPADLLRPAAEVVRVFAFEEADDRDYNLEPDDWVRISRPGYPPYVKCQLTAEEAFEGRRAFAFTLDGGNAAWLSPPVAIDPCFEYVVDAWIRTEGLRRDDAFVSVNFADRTGGFLRRCRQTSPKLTGTQPWQRVIIGPVFPDDPAAVSLVVGCHLVGRQQNDIRGKAWFDLIVVSRLPRLELASPVPHRLCLPDDPKLLRCTVRGVNRPDLTLALRLRDLEGRELARREVPVQAGPDRQAQIDWTLPGRDIGFLTAEAVLMGGGRPVVTKTLGWLVVPPARPLPPTGTEFGWSSRLPSIPLADFADLVGRAGVGWLKLSFWAEALQDVRLAGSTLEFNRFADQLQRRHVRLVGMLATPPPEVAARLPTPPTSAAEVFQADKSLWADSLSRVIGQYGLTMRWWQLGGDHDASLSELPGAPHVLTATSRVLLEIAGHLHLGIPWDWLYPVPDYPKAGMAFVSLDLTPELQGEAIIPSIRRARRPGAEVWVTIRPLEADRYSRLDRLWDLCERVLYAKAAGADRLFLSDVWDSQRGLLSSDGTPNELFLVFRTLVEQLSGAVYLGSIEMPNASRNLVFQRGDQALLAVWNPRTEVEEHLFLGPEAVCTDLWGQQTPLSPQPDAQRLRVGRLPIFVERCHLAVVQWHLAVRLESGRVPSLYRPHPDAVYLTNTFDQGVVGQVHLALPPDWTATPSQWPFHLEKGATSRYPFALTFPYNAETGLKRLRLDFHVAADQPYRFSVYRSFRLGSDDLTLAVETRLHPDGDLLVTQRVHNYTPDVLSFECSLDVPFRKRQKTSIVKLEPGGLDTKVYRVSNGRELIDQQLRVTIEQVNGHRRLNETATIVP